MATGLSRGAQGRAWGSGPRGAGAAHPGPGPRGSLSPKTGQSQGTPRRGARGPPGVRSTSVWETTDLKGFQALSSARRAVS